MPRSETPLQSLTAGTSWLVAGKTIAFAFTIAIPMLLVRRMPQHEFGLYKQIFLVINSAVTLVPLGFGMTAFYFLPRDEARRAHVVFNIVLFMTVVSATFASAIVVWPHVLVVLFKEPAAAAFAPWIAAVIVLLVVGSFLEIVIVANREVRLATMTILAVQIIRAAILLAALTISPTIQSILVASVMLGLLQVGVLHTYLSSRFPQYWRAFDWRFLRQQVAYALPFSAAGVLFSLQRDLHSYFVSNRFGPAAYAVYSIGCFQLPLFGILAESVGSMMILRFSALQRDGQTREMILLGARAMRKLAMVYFPAYAFLMVMRRDFITALFTDRYLASVPIFAWNLTLIPIGIFVLDPLFRAFSAHRYFPMKLHGALLVCFAVGLPVAVGRFGLLGAIGIVVVLTLAALVASVTKAAAILDVRMSDVALLSDVGKIAAAAAMAGIGTELLRGWIVPLKPAAALAAAGPWFVAVYTLATILLGIFTADERAFAVSSVRVVAARAARLRPRKPRALVTLQD